MSIIPPKEKRSRLLKSADSVAKSLKAAPGREEDAKALQGLSTVHNCTLPSSLFWVGGSLALVHRSKRPEQGHGENHAKRGKVTTFSVGSRRRLLRMFGKVDRKSQPVFVTLTYPDLFPDNPAEWKHHLKLLKGRFMRRFRRCGFVGRLELVTRKSGENAGKLAPHFHLLVWGAEYAHLLMFFRRAWYEVVGSGDEKHLRAGVRVERVKSWKGVFCYASKYIAKEAEGGIISQYPGGVGRWWYVCNIGYIPFVKAMLVQLTDKEAVTLIRYMRRFARMRSRSYFSLYTFLDAEFWWQHLSDILYPA